VGTFAQKIKISETENAFGGPYKRKKKKN
jgi:hypothetical protein